MTGIKRKIISWRARQDFIAWWPDLLGVLLLILGLAGEIVGPDPYLPFPRLEKFHRDISTELIGIGLTVLIIDNANQLLSTREEKKRLILQMGSPDNAFAVEAARLLRARGWLFDGTLKKADLSKADLCKADLSMANLSNADLSRANLMEADLIEVDLSEAVLTWANLAKVCLVDADLRGADLFAANLSGANLHTTNLSGANLYRADLSRANLEWASVTEEQLAMAKSIDGATMPTKGPRLKIGRPWSPPKQTPPKTIEHGMEHHNEDILTVDEAAALLKVPRTTIYKLAQQGRIPAIKVGKHWRFYRPHLFKMIAGEPTGDHLEDSPFSAPKVPPD